MLGNEGIVDALMLRATIQWFKVLKGLWQYRTALYVVCCFTEFKRCYRCNNPVLSVLLLEESFAEIRCARVSKLQADSSLGFWTRQGQQ